MYLQLQTFGNPLDAISLKESTEVKSLQQGEIKVKIQASPINPADLNFMQGTYGIKPSLPSSLGLEGAGIVLESANEKISEGCQVIFLNPIGCWASEVIVKEEDVIVLSTPIDPLQAAMLKINPMTAWCLLNAYSPLEEGDYILQNASNSGVGQSVIQLAKLLGLKTINLVRREELIEPLKHLGADIVLLDHPEVAAELKTILLDSDQPKLALNAVGGDSALRLMDMLAPEGDHITYGAMGLRSLKVPNKFLIFKGINLHGFWLTRELKNIPREQIEDIYQSLALWTDEGKLSQLVDSTFSLKDYKEAFERQVDEDREGKVLFQSY